MEKYDVDYFIRKFEAILEKKWTVGPFGCAYAHCGQYQTFNNPECDALSNLFELHKDIMEWDLSRSPKSTEVPTYYTYTWLVVDVNDDDDRTKYRQHSPKQRILAALYDIKKMQQKEVKEKCDSTMRKLAEKPKETIRYVSVPESIKEQKEELILN